MSEEIKSSELKASPLTIMVPSELHPVVASLQNSIYGTEKLESFVEVYYKSWKAISNLKNFNIITFASGLMLPFFSVATSLKEEVNEALDLQDEEIEALVAGSVNYDLGDEEAKARQVLKLLLVSLQTYSVFSK